MTPDVERRRERPVEGRLRQALDARAAEVTVRGLRPADPPGPHVRRLPLPFARMRGFSLPLAGLAAAAAALVGYLVLAPDQTPARPVPPASPPEITAPAPRTSPPPPTPAPSVAPSAAPSSPSPSPSSPRVATTPRGRAVPSAGNPSAAAPSRVPSGRPGAAGGPVPSSSPTALP
ncbi:hypothetical protein ACFWBF_02355 [Streptomyces sp. NPDC060028]|uniref:hypothetical protein n=1 Tax=Streptomyces sp. NPDC060028 TaxID=3347041 RepID=UPI0036C010BD